MLLLRSFGCTNQSQPLVLENENVNINFIHVSVIFEIEMLVYMVFEI